MKIITFITILGIIACIINFITAIYLHNSSTTFGWLCAFCYGISSIIPQNIKKNE